MEKLTLAHLAPYLPYGLKGIFTHLPGGREFELTSVFINKDDEEYDDSIGVSGTCGQFGGETSDISNFKPILRPMSDLGTAITTSGHELNPIVDLFNTKYAPGAYEVIKIEQSNGACSLTISWDKIRSSIHRFSYAWSDGSFVFHNGSRHDRVGHQFEMFNKLFSWHFDVFGLIGKGLAISIHDVKEVPNV